MLPKFSPSTQMHNRSMLAQMLETKGGMVIYRDSESQRIAQALLTTSKKMLTLAAEQSAG